MMWLFMSYAFTDLFIYQIRDFVSRFMPAYELYLPALYQSCIDPSYTQPRLMVSSVKLVCVYSCFATGCMCLHPTCFVCNLLVWVCV
ncbi:hypothetical protein EON63_13530 [archaeon]|nr:MAG: hypothetical protein EON63_13530 [archaeon]